MEGITTILDLVARRAEASPEAVALLGAAEQTITYHHLLRLMRRIAAVLRAHHIERSDRVVTVLPGGIPAAVGFLGVVGCAIAVPLNPDLGVNDFRFYYEDLEAKALLGNGERDSAAFAAAEELGLRIIEDPLLSGSARRGQGDDEAASETGPGGDDVALILYTSGTTSTPKRVPLTHANLVASAENIASGLALTREDRCLNPMPLFHIHGLVAGLLAPLVSSGSAVCVSNPAGSRMLDWLKLFCPTWYTAVPTMHQSLLSEMEGQGIAEFASHSLRLIRSSSSPLPLRVLTALEERFGIPVIEAYGMTEATHQIASNPLPPRRRKPGSVGRPLGVEVAILGPDGQLQPPCVEGEILIRGETVTSGYEGDNAANARAFIDGWFRTGDAGHVDNDGYIYLTGRLKEMINRGGEKIAPREVDEALLEHPSIAQAMAFAVPHPTLGQDVAAAVVLHDGAVASEAQLRSYLLDKVAAFKVPSRFVFLDEFPTGATGKQQRIGLADRLAPALIEPLRPPETPVEVALAQIWEGVLRADRIGATDNFFMLGGDSLSAARVLARINRRFGIHLALRKAFESPKLEDLAVLVELKILDSIEGTDD